MMIQLFLAVDRLGAISLSLIGNSRLWVKTGMVTRSIPFSHLYPELAWRGVDCFLGREVSVSRANDGQR